MTFKERLCPQPGMRVLVTAGASGIGAVIAAAFAETGANLHICDIDDTALAAFKKRFPSAEITRADVADEAQVVKLFETQRSRFGGLDVLINCAGIAGPTASVDKITEDAWLRTVEVNLTGQFHCLRQAVPMLRESKCANIVCISSVGGRLGFPWRTPYAATKWGVVGIVKSLAIELGPDNIRVNAVLPGAVEGPRIDAVISARAKQEGKEESELRKEYFQKISLRRFVTADDVALTCLFLCSPAGQNISGQAIGVDGNMEYL
jgi:NAD(P)-dependent dehydrogenase (short-subunit alcohol dehydrogenase family)